MGTGSAGAAGAWAGEEAWARGTEIAGSAPGRRIFPATTSVSGELAATVRAYTAVQAAVPAPPGATMEAVPAARVTGAVQC